MTRVCFVKKILYSPLTLILALYIPVFLIINPFSEVAVNDEWAHTRQVDAFLHHSWRIQINTDASLILLALAGFIWSLIFGYSLVKLKILIFLSSLILLFYAYKTFKLFNLNYVVSFLGLISLMFNPLVLHLSGVFMTDVPFLALMAASIYYFVKEMQGYGKINSYLGIIFSGLSMLVRQGGAFVFCGWFLYKFFKTLSAKEKLIRVFNFYFPELLVFVVFTIVYLFWPRYGGSSLTHLVSDIMDLNKIENRAFFQLYSLFYITFFLSPIALFQKIKLKKLTVVPFLLVGAVITILIYRNNVFQSGNILYLEGLYAKSNQFFQVNLLNNAFAKLIYSLIIGFLCVKIFFKIPSWVKAVKESESLLFLSFIWVIIFLGLIIPNDHYDRYVLPVFYVSLIIYAISFSQLKIQKLSNLLPLLFSVLIVAFNILLVYEFTQNNQRRWEASRKIKLETGILSKIFVNGAYSRYISSQKIKDFTGNIYVDTNAQYLCAAQTLFIGSSENNKINVSLTKLSKTVTKLLGKPDKISLKSPSALGIPKAKDNYKNIYYRESYLSPLYNVVGYKVEVQGWCDKRLIEKKAQ